MLLLGNTLILPEGARVFDTKGIEMSPEGLPQGVYVVRLKNGAVHKVLVK